MSDLMMFPLRVLPPCAVTRALIGAAVVVAVASSTAGAQQTLPPRPPTAVPTPAPPATGTGRLAGRVIDAQTGLPIPGAQIVIEARPEQATTDLDGRFRTGLLPEGRYTVRARRLGLAVKQYEGIVVSTGQTTVVNFGLSPTATTLAAVAVTAEQTERASSAAGLLGAQQRAAAASDGISEEQISRTPDSDAGAAAQRVSGVSVVDNKFVVVRGLAERYSNTLLNGVEVSSPEPTKKIVPLDLFPAALLDAIVVTKSATPDKPGDFSGGSVEIRTKEFPENNVRSASLSVGYNDRSTFESARMPEQRGLDRFGFDDGRRAAPAFPASDASPQALERFAEGIRREWNPAEQSVAPNMRLTMNAGGRAPGERLDLGYVLALTYSAENKFDPSRFSQFFADPDQEAQRGFVYRDARRTVDWGAVANFAIKLGRGTKLGWKNLYTRNAEELFSTTEGFNVDRNGDLRGYQFQYIERDLLQSQLTGDHLVKLLFPSRVEWKATYSASNRDEPDNRQLLYLRTSSDTAYVLGTNNDAWFRFLDDRQASGQLDWNVPLRLRRSADALLKVGGLARRKERNFKSSIVSFTTSPNTPSELLSLPPEKLFLPEIVGNILTLSFPGDIAQPYDADDNLLAYYGMLDIPLLSRLRVVGGARMEQWSLDLFDGGRKRYDADTASRPTIRRHNDLLWSTNVTYAISDRMNVRLAAFKSVARPDTRELSRDAYQDVVGGCPTVGNPSLRRSLVINSDARWEWYPNPGEIVAISGFFKDFDSPIIRTVNSQNTCTFTFENAISAQLYGGEIDIRKGLTFLPGPLSRLSASMNFTISQSTLVMDPRFGIYDADLQLEGQSPFLANAGLTYASEESSLSATVLYSYFDDRIARYGFRSSGGADATQGPNITEEGRGQLDLKIQKQLFGGMGVSLAARNLTGAVESYTQQLTAGVVQTGRTFPGRSISLGISLSR